MERLRKLLDWLNRIAEEFSEGSEEEIIREALRRPIEQAETDEYQLPHTESPPSILAAELEIARLAH